MEDLDGVINDSEVKGDHIMEDLDGALKDDTIELLYLEDGKTGRVFIGEFHLVN